MTHDFQRAVIDCLTIAGLAVGALGLSVLLTEWCEWLQEKRDAQLQPQTRLDHEAWLRRN